MFGFGICVHSGFFVVVLSLFVWLGFLGCFVVVVVVVLKEFNHEQKCSLCIKYVGNLF